MRALVKAKREPGIWMQDLPVPEDWSILVEKATQLPEQQPSTRQQQMAQQQQTRRRVNLRSLDI